MTTSCQTARAFRIETPIAEVDDLRRRLEHARWPTVLPDAGWSQGAALDYVQDLADYWRESYDWRAHEAALNGLPHFMTEIDGQAIHFLHVRSTHADALPLLLVHGWPGSFVEFLDVIDPLTEPEGGLAFDLVIPSVPGFAFSSPLREAGWTTARIARAFVALMGNLGYDRFGVQGGDWGARIAPDVGRAAPDHVVGVHVNAATTGFLPTEHVDERHLSDADRDRMARLREFRASGSAYFQLQATRPQTLAYGLTDSPAGLLAWIGEKFHDWSHEPTRIDRNRLLTNITLHWLTNTANSAARIYSEHTHAPGDLSCSGVPTGVAVFAEDLAIRASAEQHNHIVHWSDFEHGGHFAALEEPELLVEDIRTFFTARSTT
jgi:pimeloyl-ACP methyl ester carboxylesterase